jgi:hypothetical protein
MMVPSWLRWPPNCCAVMIDILKRFFAQWDSGGSVWAMAPVLQRLIAGKPLSPLTGADSEWIDCSEFADGPIDASGTMPKFWQNVRCSTVFKDADGAYDIDAPGEARHPVSFPYSPEGAEIGDPVVEF